MFSSISPEPHEIYTVSQLNLEARVLLEESFRTIWILGEISNLSRPSSGHLYFSLKDQNAQIRCALFRMSRTRMNFVPENGMQVLVQAQVSLYEARGDFQLIVVHMEPAGNGALQIAFEKLKHRLAAEGLFAEEHKQPIPKIPKKIGVITSPTGAAIQDIITVLKRRFARIPIIIYPTKVQGEQAAAEIVAAIQIANERNECDVLILARGGGSLEDLWPFNEEKVARAIYASKIPLVTGIGHEIDFTIADFVADLRCPTPSAAAECVSPNKKEYQQLLKKIFQHLLKCISTHLQHEKVHLTHLQKRLRHPGQRLRDQAQRLDQLEQSLSHAHRNYLTLKKAQLKQYVTKFFSLTPARKLEIFKTQTDSQKKRFFIAWNHLLQQKKLHLQTMSQHLEAMSPTKTLQRGYAIITKKDTQEIIRSSEQVSVGDQIRAQVATGIIDSIVDVVV